MSIAPTCIDVVIFGGGATGLWLLDELHRAGYSACLLESSALGAGQSVASQGIIHGGLKYTLKGLFTSSADAIKEMPALWRSCLHGRSQPDLRATPIRAECCHLWSTDALMSRMGLFAASAALAVKPKALPRDRWPAVLRGCTGSVSLLDEQVISPHGFIAALAAPHASRLVKYEPQELAMTRDSAGAVQEISLSAESSHAGFKPAGRITLRPRTVVLTAGQGNADLRSRCCLSTDAMQRRPVHIALARHTNLPTLNGHCVDGNKTRVTITSDRDRQGRIVWQIGGQVSEDGVGMTRARLIAHVKEELRAALPGFDTRGLEWSSYLIDRAEGANRGQRPADATVLREGNVITCWPTKLALVPAAAARLMALLPPPSGDTDRPETFEHCVRPTVAQPPWETIGEWLD